MGLQVTSDYLIRRAVQRFSDELAVVSGEVRLTFAQFDDRLNRLQNALLSLGVKKGDRVGVLLHNSLQGMECNFAFAKAGFVLVPLNARLSGNEHAYMLNHSEANTVIFGEEFTDIIKDIKPQLPIVKNYIRVGGGTEDFRDYEFLLNSQSNIDPMIQINEEDLSSIRYTSGTTGLPKGVMVTEKNHVASAINQILDSTRPEKDDVVIHVGPITHASGALMLPHFMKGAVNVILPEFDPKLLLETIQTEKGTTLMMVPTMILFLINYPKLHEYDLSSLKTILYGAAPMPVEHLKQAQKKLGNIFAQGYGLTEAGAQCVLLSKEDHKIDGNEKEVGRLSSAGRELTLIQIKILDNEGNELPQGKVGEITVKGNHVMKGYWKNPLATEERLQDGWLRTGDMGFMDEDRYLFIVDRKHDMIISGGFNIYPREVEEALHAHNAIFQSAVIGVPDDEWGEAVKAFVVLKDGHEATESEIIEFVKSKIASYKKPKSIEFVESIPVNPYGKVMRRELREPFWRERTRNI
ncbi:long-chain-fatty-acid--CoA ligase [Bacillus dakarensis]|uniref:long-chain-fatty-acid--CoA ligase n=1 Tax=Robertmurraya dakarensis TaxID=1926278 RepID=UPI0009812837|nr:long-chain-fatty-acid--CoA ligase [Bacillus dakarensis]